MKVAVLGATGAVGRTMMALLEQRLPGVTALVPLASPSSAGSHLMWRGVDRRVETPAEGRFRGCALALFSAGAAVSREWAPVAAAEGAVVIDNSSAWRMDADVPLVVPEVNAASMAHRPKGILANPNCSTIQVVLPLKALLDAAGLRRVQYATYQSASGAGEKGSRALARELAEDRAANVRSSAAGIGDGGTRAELHAAPDSPFPARLAGNVIPSIGGSAEPGWTEEEAKMRAETRKILGRDDLPVAATCVRVPVEVGHSVAVTVETARPIDAAAAREAIAAFPGVEVDDRPFGPLALEVAGTDAVRVGRIRQDPDLPSTLHFWVVADNLRKGAALNAVQIAEAIVGKLDAGHGARAGDTVAASSGRAAGAS